MADDPFAGMTDEQVLARAARHLRKAATLPVGSVERSIQWAAYDASKAELDRRLFLHVVAKIAEMKEETE